MKQTRLQFFGTLALAALMASCASLDKMKEAAKQIKFNVTPEMLETHQGKVAMEFTANVPAKMWAKKVSAKITPILTYDGGQEEYPAITVQGESVTGNNQSISYTNGGTIKYPKQEINYNDKERISKLIVKIDFSMAGKDQTLTVTSEELDLAPLALGVVATSTLIYDDPAATVASKDAFQRTTTEDKVAEIVYLINQSEVRNGQLSKDDVKAINDYIKALKDDEKKNIKEISVSAYCSPDGSTDLNTKLAGKRENSAKSYVEKQLKKADAISDIVTKSTPEDWEGFKTAVENSDIQDKELILRVLSLYSDADVREKEIKNLSSLYKTLANNILPQLRRSTVTVTGELVGRSDEELKNDPVDSLNIEELLYAANLVKGDADAQIKYYDAAIKNFPNDYRGYNNKGVVLFEKDDVEGAKTLFTQAEGINAAPEVENNLGACALASDDLNAAKEYFGKAAGAGDELNENLASCAILEGDYEKAESYYGNSTSTNAALVKILLKKDDAAISTLNANAQETGIKYYLKAIAYAHKSDKDSCFENLRKSIELEAVWKEYAKTDREFNAYFEDSTFKSIVE